MQTTSPGRTFDRQAAETVAKGLGLRTRSLVEAGDVDQAIEWALQMSREHTGVTALSYYELAVILGHRDPEVTARTSLDWSELLQAAEKLAGTVRAKAADERAAKEKAKAEKAAAEDDAAGE